MLFLALFGQEKGRGRVPVSVSVCLSVFALFVCCQRVHVPCHCTVGFRTVLELYSCFPLVTIAAVWQCFITGSYR